MSIDGRLKRLERARRPAKVRTWDDLTDAELLRIVEEGTGIRNPTDEQLAEIIRRGKSQRQKGCTSTNES